MTGRQGAGPAREHTAADFAGLDGAAPDREGPDSAAPDRAGPDRAEVIEMLAAFGDRAARDVRDEIGSLELTWLIAQFEERYSTVVELSDAQLNRVRTVADATDALRDALGLAPSGEDRQPAPTERR